MEGGKLYYNVNVGQCFINYDKPDKLNSLGHHINIGENGKPMMNYESKQIMVSEFNGLRNMLLLVGGVLSFIIGLIGILNFVNSMLTSIITRRQEFAMMQSIGMTNKQLRKMLCPEGLYYALTTILVSLILDIIFSVAVVGSIAKNMWFFSYQFVIWTLMASYPLLILFSIFIPAVSLHSFNLESIVKMLRIAE